MNNQSLVISIIITTYSSPNALRLVLLALAEQNSDNFEVVVADDGSNDETRETIELLKVKVGYTIKHVWQEHNGFRAAMIRNKGAAIASGEYLIFLDGDSIPLVSFIERHRKLAENGYFVAGNRVLLFQELTEKALQQNITLQRWHTHHYFYAFYRGWVNRFLPILYLRGLYPRYLFRNKWQGARTCNLGVWRKDFLNVNGFDESYYGWGYEDSDFAVRLIRNGVLHKDGRFAVPILHLWHPKNNRVRESENYQKLQEVIHSSRIKAEYGVAQYFNIE